MSDIDEGRGREQPPAGCGKESALRSPGPGPDEAKEHVGWIAERARLQEELLLAQQDVQRERTDRGHLLAQLREGNERLVIASVRADELAERAEAGRRRAEVSAAQLAVSEAAMRASEAAMCMSARQLRESEEQLRAALVAGKMAHWRWDPDSGAFAGSGTLNEVFGLLPGKALQWHTQVVHLIHPEDVQEHSSVLEAANVGRLGWQREFRIVRPRDHEVAWLEESATSIANSLTGKWEVTGLVRDVTERKRAEECLREREEHTRMLLAQAVAARAEAEAAIRARDEFLTTVNHELRTPIAAILLWARALGTGLGPAETARAVEAITQSAHCQSQLIEDLLELSRLTSGRFALSTSAVDFAAVVADAVDMMLPILAAKDIDFKVQIEPTSIVAALDPRRMKQILGNILGNAAKFTPSGGAVRLVVRALDARIDIELSDTGDGITAEFLPYVFERFRQADMSDTRRHNGLGIGLAITKQLVELHGGTIDVQSEGAGLGAQFHIRLPWRKLESHSAPGRGNAASFNRGLRLAGLRILMVESDTNTREAMQWALSREGAHITQVATGGEALRALQGNDAPDVIISELGLPDISGFDLMRQVAELSAKDGHLAPPSCAVSERARPCDRRLAIEAGFDMVLAKPMILERLVEAMADLQAVLVAKA